ncbi:MAG: vitamin B12-dependent ribonucleotide reductase [Acidimicrobiia bacterium]|nr:vitamin B12-dependent ribonucleotide reductase [Acidimicrobiia bacterium]
MYGRGGGRQVSKGLKVDRRFTRGGEDPYETVAWSKRDTRIANTDGSVVFEMKDAEIPVGWSQVAADIIVSKYFRKAGVPLHDSNGTLLDENHQAPLGSERSARQVFDRLAGTWRWWGEQGGYFASQEDAQAFEDELKYMLCHQMASPNSPQWFNTGLNWAYGLTGPAQGFWYVDPQTETMTESPDSYSRPAPHACFILKVEDDLVNPGGIMDLWLREARIFKFGSGAGSNFSAIRAEGEKLSGGGSSSGVMSFLKIGDRAAGAIKSGGTTRRAAKMVILDIDHPDVEEFINWKRDEEDKARILIEKGGFAADFNGEAYATISGQNSNNSVRVNDAFIKAVETGAEWPLTERTTGKVMKTVSAGHLWNSVAEAAWACADPGVQFDTTVNEWHTCPEGGRIRGSNPCSEYMFLDNTACNLASLNLVAFYDDRSGAYDIDGYLHAIRLWTMVLEISVAMAHFPSRAIAQGSYDYRTLGLGYANLGSLLMRKGIPYDSPQGRAIAGALTAILTGHGYATSAEMASVVGPFPRFQENREAMLRVIRNHRHAAYDSDASEYEGISQAVAGISRRHCPPDLAQAAREAWDNALEMGTRHGYRNAQLSCLAPTGTIGLQMDCDTTGVEPDFALVKFKKLAGGGYFKIVNHSVGPALDSLGYMPREKQDIIEYVVGTSSLDGAPHINRRSLRAHGFTDADLDRIEASLPEVFELRHAFNALAVGEATLRRLGVEPDQYQRLDFDLLSFLGFTPAQIDSASDYICGHQTIEGAPHLREEHLPVFDTANRNGRHGKRFIHHNGHIRMMAAAQPFISGAISKTINMPNEVEPDDIKSSYHLSWELGLKAIALYRDGSKASQPLSSAIEDSVEGDDPALEEALGIEQRLAYGSLPEGTSPAQAYAQGMNPPRFLLSSRRRGWTREARVGGHKLFIRTGEYEDGTLGELFIDLAKEGATLRGILSCFAIAVSKGLQYGVPLEEYVDTFLYQTFEPRGMVQNHPNIKMASSMVDYIFRALAIEYLDREDLGQVKTPSPGELPEEPHPAVSDRGTQPTLDAAQEESNVEAVQGAAAFVEAPPLQFMSPGDPLGEILAQGAAVATAPSQAALSQMMGDAPMCDECGHITVRNGSCYRCLNCGASLGCS